MTIDTDLSKSSCQRFTLTSINQKTITKSTAPISGNAQTGDSTSNWPWDCPLLSSVADGDNQHPIKH